MLVFEYMQGILLFPIDNAVIQPQAQNSSGMRRECEKKKQTLQLIYPVRTVIYEVDIFRGK